MASQYPLPRKLLFKTVLEERIFLEDWNKGNVVKNYRRLSVLPILRKILERIKFRSSRPEVFLQKGVLNMQ